MSDFEFTKENVTPAFSTPIYYSNIKGLNFDINTLDLGDENTFAVNALHTNVLTSQRKNVLTEARFKKIRLIADEAMRRYVHDILRIPTTCTLKLIDSWVVVGTPGSETNLHLHANSLFSGVFYIQSLPDAGVLGLYMPESQNTYCTPTIRPQPEELNIFNSAYWYVEPQTHDVVIFPSHVMHRVSRNNSGHVRIAIAFNYFLEGLISESNSGRLKISAE